MVMRGIIPQMGEIILVEGMKDTRHADNLYSKKKGTHKKKIEHSQSQIQSARGINLFWCAVCLDLRIKSSL